MTSYVTGTLQAVKYMCSSFSISRFAWNCDTVYARTIYHCVPCDRPHMVPGLHWLSSAIGRLSHF